MAKVRVKLNSPGIASMLNEAGIRSFVDQLAARVAAAARANAPVGKVNGGTYRDSIESGTVTTDRPVGRVWAHAKHAPLIESRTGNLARALDAAGGG